MLGDTVPATIQQNRFGVVNPKLEKAKAVSYSYFIKNGRNPDIEEEFYEVFEDNLIKAIDELNEKTEYVRFELFTIRGLRQAFSDDIRADLNLI